MAFFIVFSKKNFSFWLTTENKWCMVYGVFIRRRMKDGKKCLDKVDKIVYDRVYKEVV